MPEKTIECDNLVIGSGPGGSITACMLAEAGKDVVLLEEGVHSSIDSTDSYSLDEMNKKYRNGGLTPAFGKTKVSYIEGRCVGGGSEINAGLFHRPLPETLQKWKDETNILDFGEAELIPHFEAIEKELSVSIIPDGVGPAAKIIQKGAEKMNWEMEEVPRFWKYEKKPDDTWVGTRQSMSQTLVPRAVQAGCRLVSNTRVDKFQTNGKRAVTATGSTAGEAGRPVPVQINFKNAFVCGGAIQTPLLLRRSGIKRNVGSSLCMHPMARMPARFNDTVNDKGRGVPANQIKEFKPHMTLGCSLSSPAYLALWLAGEFDDIQKRLEIWPQMAVYYTAVVGEGRGVIRNFPFFDEAFVRYPLTLKDRVSLGEGLYQLGRLLFEAGATELFPPIAGHPPATSLSDLEALRKGIPDAKSNITTIHLFSSCPMGEDQSRCPVDSFGEMHGYDNIFLNDASILPSSPGVNPQAVIMAIARRNVMRFLEMENG